MYIVCGLTQGLMFYIEVNIFLGGLVFLCFECRFNFSGVFYKKKVVNVLFFCTGRRTQKGHSTVGPMCVCGLF